MRVFQNESKRVLSHEKLDGPQLYDATQRFNSKPLFSVLVGSILSFLKGLPWSIVLNKMTNKIKCDENYTATVICKGLIVVSSRSQLCKIKHLNTSFLKSTKEQWENTLKTQGHVQQQKLCKWKNYLMDVQKRLY